MLGSILGSPYIFPEPSISRQPSSCNQDASKAIPLPERMKEGLTGGEKL